MIKKSVLTVAMALFGLAFSGCTDSSESAATKEGAEKVNAAQRLIRSGSQEIALNAAEINSIAKTDSRKEVSLEAVMTQAQAGGQRVAERLSAENDLTLIKTLQEELSAISQNFTAEKEAEFLQKIQMSADEIAKQISQIGQLSRQDNQARLERARQMLEEAEKAGKAARPGDSTREWQSAPQAALGTLHLILARRNASEMERHYLQIQPALVDFNHNLSLYVEHEKIAGIQQTYSPAYSVNLNDKSVNAIDQIKQAVAANDIQLAEIRKAIGEIQKTKDEQDAALKTLAAAAGSMRKEYWKVMAEAEAVKGQQRYDLKSKAYQIDTGPDGKGCIYYETQVELAEKGINDLNNTLAYMQKREQESAAAADKLSVMIVTLQTSPETTGIEKTIAVHTEAMSLARQELAAVVESIKKDEMEYREIRVATVESYKLARTKFTEASGIASGSNYTTYCESMIDIIKLEMAQMWRMDAAYYESILNVLDLAGENKDLRPVFDEVFVSCQKMAELALVESQSDDLKVAPREPQPQPGAAPEETMPAAEGDTDTAGQPAMENGMDAAPAAENQPAAAPADPNM